MRCALLRGGVKAGAPVVIFSFRLMDVEERTTIVTVEMQDKQLFDVYNGKEFSSSRGLWQQCSESSNESTPNK